MKSMLCRLLAVVRARARVVFLGATLVVPTSGARAQVEDFIRGYEVSQLTQWGYAIHWKSDCSRPEILYSRLFRASSDGTNVSAYYNPDTTACSNELVILSRITLDGRHAYWVGGDGGVRRFDQMRNPFWSWGGNDDPELITVSTGDGFVSPNGPTTVSRNFFFWSEELGEFRDKSILYRVGKTPGSAISIVASHATETLAYATRLHAVSDDQLIYLLGDGRLLEVQRVLGGTPPLLFYYWRPPITLASNVTALRVARDRLWWFDRSADGRTVGFRSTPITNLTARTLHFSATQPSAHRVNEFDTDGTQLFYQDLTSSSSGPLLRKALTNSVPPAEVASLAYAATDLQMTTFDFVMWRKDHQTISRLKFDEAAITRDLAVSALEVVQTVQNASNENPLVMGKPTFVRLFGRVAGSSAGETVVQMTPGAYLQGEVNGETLPESPLLPYRSAPLRSTPHDRTEESHGFWFQLPDEWTRRGQVRLRGVINPTRVVTETNYGNNTLVFQANFLRKAEIGLVMKPTLTRRGAIREYEPSMQATFDYLEALLPTSELRVAWDGGLTEEPWDPAHLIGDGGPFEVSRADDDGWALLTSLTLQKLFTSRRYCLPAGHGYEHAVAMLRTQEEMPTWSGYATTGFERFNFVAPASTFFHRPAANDLGVPGGAATQAQELAHNYGRMHVNCGPNVDSIDPGFPYDPCALASPESGYLGFNPFTRRLIKPADARDFMSYAGPEWVSDYTWKSLLNLIGDLPPAESSGAAAAPANDSGAGLLASILPPVFRSPVLALDFNDRSDTNLVAGGFLPFVMATTDGTGIQTNPITRTYGALSVTLRAVGAEIGYDDRVRATPVTSGTFTDTALLRDFVFSRDTTGNGGLNLEIRGLRPSRIYSVKLWSFDSTSLGRRVSDWSANGTPVVANYAFDGRLAPTSNEQYRMDFDGISDSTGTLVIAGRRDSVSTNELGQPSFGVFLNAIELSESIPAPVGSSLMIGIIDHHGDAAFHPVQPLNGAELASAQAMLAGMQVGMRYQIQAMQRATVLASYSVHLSESPTDAGGEHATVFAAIGDIPALTDRLRLVAVAGGLQVLGEIEGGARRPTVLVTAPAEGTTYARTSQLNVGWTGTDPDGHALAYTVRYSADNRATWQVLASGRPGSTLSVPVAGLPGGSSAWIEVIASDGILTGSDQAGPFTVAPGVPKAYAFVETPRGKICRPLARVYVRAGETVTFHGESFDPEDGELSGSQMYWQSFGPARFIIRGRQATVEDLPPGDYAVYLYATDSDGHTAAAIVNLTVDPHFIETAKIPINLDGQTDDAGYLADTQPLPIRYASGEIAQVRMVRDGPNVLVAATGLRNGNHPGEAFSVLLDTNSSGGTTPGEGDLRFEITPDGSENILIIRGGAYEPVPAGFAAVTRSHGSSWSAEIKIDLGTFGAWDGRSVRLSFAHERIDLTGELVRAWPTNTIASRPATYGSVVLGPDPNEPTDLDGDGLPDRYELAVFGDIKTEPFNDADGDRLTNLQEWESGTDPTDPNSNLRVRIVRSGATRRLEWTPVPERSYTVLGSADLADWYPLASNVSDGQWTVPANSVHRFFRLEVCHGR